MAESNLKHTPGPWEASRTFRVQTVCAPHITICHTDTFGTAGQAHHNAQLIAAAPELLEALKDLLRDAQDRLTEVPDELYHRCREIITRAEGRP